jgi:hypothetical protein
LLTGVAKPRTKEKERRPQTADPGEQDEHAQGNRWAQKGDGEPSDALGYDQALEHSASISNKPKWG